MKTIINVKSPIGTDLVIDFSAETISAPSKGFSGSILGWSTINHEGKLCKACETRCGKNIVIGHEYYKPVVESLDAFKREQYLARRAAIYDAIPGLSLLETALESREQYLDAFNRMMDDEQNDGVTPPKFPNQNVDELRVQYPRAALYLKAQAYSCAANDRKVTAGEKAMKVLVSGGEESDAAKILDNWLNGVFID